MAASFLRSRLTRMPRLKALIKEGIRIAERLPRVTAGSIDDEFLIALLARDDPVILDIGCNDGTHTRWFLDLFPRARVFSFEPDPRARKRYAANVVSDRAVLFDLAISDRDGLIEFHVSGGKYGEHSKDWDQSGSIRKPKLHLEMYPSIEFEQTIKVNTRRLDTWAAEQAVDSIDFIWADVQGAEVDLIKGGRVTLGNTRYFYTEYSNRELYAGQIGLKTLLKSLPEFDVVHRYETDVLLGNKSMGS
jgi:FkbM family methyltransferase